MKKTILLIISIILMVSLVACGDNGAVLKDGKISLEGTIIDFGENIGIDKKSAILKTVKATENEEENGLYSPLYELTLKQDLTEPITISIPIPKEYTGEDGETLLMGLGVEAEYDSGRVSTEYFYFPVEIIDNIAKIEFSPKEISEAPLYMGATEGSAKANRVEIGLSLKCGLFGQVAYFKEGGHFRLYYPLKVDGKFFHHIVGTSGIEDILKDLEFVYQKYKKLGYKYNEKDFPMNILIKSIDDDGSYHGLFKDITININKFDGTYKSGQLNSLLWHEFFHYVQGCYTGAFNTTDWIDEATASYYEATANEKSSTTLTAQYFEKQFTSALPIKSTAQDGYARSPLIFYLSKKIGDDTWIRKVYEQGGNTEAFIAVVGDPLQWAHSYYLALASGQVGDLATYTLYKNTTSGVYKGDVGTTLKLNIPTADEIEKVTEDELLIGSTKVTMNGQGSRLIAITVDNDTLKNLPDGADVKIECKGASVTVLSAKGKEVKKLGKSLTGLKKSIDDKQVYLAVVTSSSEKEASAEFEVKVKLSLKKIDFSGTYKGIMNVTKTGKDYEVTTVVTYEKEFGDGDYYKIVCTNNETGSKYINNSYFVRKNGESNIAGAEFNFSSDGTSFTATMKEFDGKVWGNLNGQK